MGAIVPVAALAAKPAASDRSMMPAESGVEDRGLRRFALGSCIGRGGHGEVYRCSLRSAGGLDTTVAVKVLREDAGLGEEGVRRLRDEGRMLARLNHPTIVRIMDMVLLGGRPALITEFIDGADLSDCVASSTPMGVRAQIQVVAQVAGALEDARRTVGLVHRDLKPTNIRIGRHGQVKLIDFGIARAGAVSREASTHTDAIIGSIPYMAPERFADRRTRSASDVFSLGCVLYEGLTTERLYGKAATHRVPDLSGDRQRFEDYVNARLCRLSDAIPQAVRHMLTSTLAYPAEERPTTSQLAALCEELGDDLEGPSLRMWCRDAVWPDVSEATGTLTGQVLTEGVLILDIDEDAANAEDSTGPSIHLQPMVTLDTSRIESQLAVSAHLGGAALGSPGDNRRSIDERAWTDDQRRRALPLEPSDDDDEPPRFPPRRRPTRRPTTRDRVQWWLIMMLSGATLVIAAGVVLTMAAGVAYLAMTR